MRTTSLPPEVGLPATYSRCAGPAAGVRGVGLGLCRSGGRTPPRHPRRPLARQCLGRKDALTAAAGTLPALVEAEGLVVAAHLGVYQAQLADSLDCATHALKLFREGGDNLGIARGLIQLAYLQLHTDDRDAAQATAAEALSVAAQADDDLTLGSARKASAATAAEFAIAKPIAAEAAPLLERAGDLRALSDLWNDVGWLALIEGALSEADQLFERALELTESPIDHAYSIGNRGHVAREQGDLGTAATRFATTLVLCRTHGLRGPVYETLAGLGAIAAANGDATCAAQLAGACEATRFGHPLTPLDHRLREAIHAAKRHCEQPAWDAAHGAGSQLGLEAAIDLGLEAAAAVTGTAHRRRDSVHR